MSEDYNEDGVFCVHQNPEIRKLETVRVVMSNLIRGADIIKHWAIDKRKLFGLLVEYSIGAYYYTMFPNQILTHRVYIPYPPKGYDGYEWKETIWSSFEYLSDDGVKKVRNIRNGYYDIGIDDLHYDKNDLYQYLKNISHLRPEYEYIWEDQIIKSNDQLYKNTPNIDSQKRSKGEVTIKDAAKILGVSKQTVINWNNGRYTPDRWPGLNRATAFYMFAEEYKNLKALRRDAREKNRAVSCGDLDVFSESAKF